jgi:GTPase SAR1 family protein
MRALLKTFRSNVKHDDSKNVVYLIGMPESGKTSLARQICGLNPPITQDVLKSRILKYVRDGLVSCVSCYEVTCRDSNDAHDMMQLLRDKPNIVADRIGFENWVANVYDSIWMDDNIQQYFEHLYPMCNNNLT